MPYYIRKVPGKSCYTVKIRSAKRPHRTMAKCTTLTKAKKQIRLLYALETPGFVPNNRTRKNR